MFNQDYYKHIRIVSGFGVDRGNYKHSGVDYPGTKRDKIVNLLDGVVQEIKYANNYFGTQCIIKTNPRFAGGANDTLFHSYCHLHNTGLKAGDFVKAGEQIGLMGNTGGCYTAYSPQGQLTNRYRPITESEKANDECFYGVHLHLWFYQICRPNQKTKLLKDLMKFRIIDSRSLGDTHFYQWGKLIIAPRVIYSYFKTIQSRS